MTESQYIFEFCDSYNKRILTQIKIIDLSETSNFSFSISQVSTIFLLLDAYPHLSVLITAQLFILRLN